MSYEFVQGNLFDASSGLKVVTVNCVGVMGKGLALECKQRYPWVYERYREQCRNEEWRPGMVWQLSDDIMLVSTKDNWRDPSQMRWIVSIVNDLAWWCRELEAATIHIPLLGCGNGNLQWRHVRPIITSKFLDHPTHALIYGGAP